MPYKSAKQERFMRGCENNPKSMKGKCPPKKVLREYSLAEQQAKALS